MKIRSLLKNHVRNNQQESVSVNRYCIALSFKIHFVQNLCNWSEVSVTSSSLSAKVAHGKMAREAGILEYMPWNHPPANATLSPAWRHKAWSSTRLCGWFCGWCRCCTESPSLSRTLPAAAPGLWRLWTEPKSGSPLMQIQRCSQSSPLTS